MLVDIPESSFLAVLGQFERWHEHKVNQDLFNLLFIENLFNSALDIITVKILLKFPKISEGTILCKGTLTLMPSQN